MSELDEEATQLTTAIAGLEAQRVLLGDAVVDLALAALNQRLAQLGPFVANLGDDERKIVTTLFVDVSGFTALSEKSDPEDVRALINSCFDCLVPVVQKYQGTVVQFMGDAMMALFGAPLAHEDDPERALRVALEMMEAMKKFNREHAIELGLHIGVNTGPVVAGNIGSHDHQSYNVMGDAVNLAARLEDASPDGEIFVGPNTHRSTMSLFNFEKLPPLKFKGKAEAIEVYRLLGRRVASERVRRVEGMQSLLIGREAELEKILSSMHALKRGEGSVLAIVGEAGLGKSRLIAETHQSLAADMSWVEGRALSYAPGINYGLARDVLRGLLGVKTDATSTATEVALRESVNRATSGNTENVYPYLARLLEVSMHPAEEDCVKYLPGEVLQKRILQAFKVYVQARSQQQPLVLVWEDLHWCDPSSMRVLETLFPLAREFPLILLLAYRPDEELVAQIDLKAAAACSGRFYVIKLLPLTRMQSSSLIQSLLKIEDLPGTIQELVVGRADGNPFFLEELIRSLIDAGIIVVEYHRIVATRVVESLDVPETLQGVLMARIDRLTAEKKCALQNASVIGRIFQQRVLAHLYAEPSPPKSRLDDSLRELQRREFILSQDQDGAEYIFKHAVTHEVAYNSLLIARRKRLHRLAAEAIETLFPDRLEELASTLGYHFEKAQVPEKAIYYLQRAAELAQAIFSNTEAIAFYRSAITQAQRLPKQTTTENEVAARLYEGLGNVLRLVGQHEGYRVAYEGALELTTQSNRISRSRLHRKIGSSYVPQRRYNETFEILERAERQLGDEPTDPAADWWQEKIEIQMERMHLFYWQLMAKEMIQLAETSRDLVEEHGAPIQKAMFYRLLALSRLSRDRYLASEEALNLARVSLSSGEGLTDLAALSDIRFVLGFINMWRGNLAEADEQLRMALKTAEKMGYVVLQTRCLNYLAVTHRRLHHIDETRNYATDALELAAELKIMEYIAMSKANLAWLAYREGNHHAALSLAREAIELSHQKPLPIQFDWMALWPVIAIALARDDLDEALVQSRALFGPTQQPLPDPLPELTRAALDASEKNQREAAQAYLARAIEAARRIGYL